MEPIIYHNPRCSKSRATLALLEQHGHRPRVIRYLEEPPDPRTLTRLLRELGLRARDLVRTNETQWKALGLDPDQVGEQELVRLLCEHPVLSQRPIVEYCGKARIGRPPEAVLELFEADGSS
ncbi:MAG: arsenate reductase (glutaredoxin) [Wenzhouxiangellaceae bacterium]